MKYIWDNYIEWVFGNTQLDIAKCYIDFPRPRT
jgi:hypothetical protein